MATRTTVSTAQEYARGLIPHLEHESYRVSRLWSDVRVSCVNPGRGDVKYTFRVLVRAGKAPKAESAAAQELVTEIGGAPAGGAPAGR